MRFRALSLLVVLPSCAATTEPTMFVPDGIAVEGDVTHAFVRSTLYSEGKALGAPRGDGQIVRISGGERTVVVPKADPRTLVARGGRIFWSGSNGSVWTQVDGGAPETISSSRGYAVDGDGSAWWIDGRDAVRWTPEGGTQHTFALAASIPFYAHAGPVATSTGLVAISLFRYPSSFVNVIYAFAKDGSKPMHVAETTESVDWLGVSETTVYWSEGRIGDWVHLQARKLDGTDVYRFPPIRARGPVVLRGDDVYLCGDDPEGASTVGRSFFPLMTRVGEAVRLLAPSECVALDADAKRVVWSDERGELHSVLR